jgi:hypothetical protein
MVARQGCCAAATADADQKGLHFCFGGVASQWCRTTAIGATKSVCRATPIGATGLLCHANGRAAFLSRWREGTGMSRHREWRDKHVPRKLLVQLLLLGLFVKSTLEILRFSYAFLV